MSNDTVRVRIGLEGARELEFDIDDGDALIKDVEAAIEKGEALMWVTDARGDRHGLAVGKVAFVQVEGEKASGGVGF
jgi:hypothetical protein